MKTIGIFPFGCYERHQKLFAAVSQLEPVCFKGVQDVRDRSANALVLLDASFADLDTMIVPGQRVLAFDAGWAHSAQASSGVIRFGASTGLSPIFRGQEFPDSSAIAPLGSISQGADILAVKGSVPVWARMESHGCLLDLVAGALPCLDQHPFLYQHLQRGACMTLLPFLHFVKELTGATTAEKPGLRACFMFDDPNLHWPSYGCLDYRSLAESAQRHNYHAAIATVPLDGWFVHQPTARLFKQHENRLSTLVHGNDHTYKELAKPSCSGDSLNLAAQSLQRTLRLEQRSGVAVSRVMAAPHGACNEAMATALLRVGYEAACISLGSLKSTNPEKVWPAASGMTPAEFLGLGLPVMPRFRITRNCHPEIMLAAFLGQPIIPVGHHQDVADGYAMLDELAEFINRLGTVHWTNLQNLARTNYSFRKEGPSVQIALYSRRVQLQICPGINQLEVRRPWLQQSGELSPLIITKPDGARLELLAGEFSPPIPCAGSESLDLFSPAGDAVDFHQLKCRPAGLWPISRRILSEGRDRVKGLLRQRTFST